MPFSPLGNTLHNNKSKKSEDKNHHVDDLIIHAATQTFEEMYGKEISQAAKPLFLKNRTLTVSCSNSEIAQKIRENQTEIVEKINHVLGKNEVDRIRYLA
ncbi:MAG TPA: hypothetical protein DCS29_04405 [Candidatus Magasanikbacteria bacterium]|nr:MAG: hypothetical protein A2479_03460 [Candidatus Magasanikbacteria bacterium RIFOXYC2_FULL_39_8]HAT03983.1 hypothetical protein [Candidatus Magasanikbacteria bacterium]